MKKKSVFIRLWATISCLLVFGVVLFLFAYVFGKGINSISWEFLTQGPKGTVLGTEGGIFPAIVGSFFYTTIAVIFASVLGFGTAIYQVFYCRWQKVSDMISLIMQCMTGVPSIVMGLFGYSLLVLALGWGKCMLAGGITQGIMILPFIEVSAEKAFREVDHTLICASYSMGVSRAYTIRRIVMPQAVGELVSAMILGSCYAMGAAAPLIFTGAVILSRGSVDLMKPAMALPYHLYVLLTQGTSPQNAYGTAFVMMLLVLISNTIATLITWRKLK